MTDGSYLYIADEQRYPVSHHLGNVADFDGKTALLIGIDKNFLWLYDVKKDAWRSKTYASCLPAAKR